MLDIYFDCHGKVLVSIMVFACLWGKRNDTTSKKSVKNPEKSANKYRRLGDCFCQWMEYRPISGGQTDENRENIGSNIGRISAWQNGSNPNLGFFPGSSFSTREASNFSIFRWIFQRWHLWSLPKLPELVWNSKRLPPIYSETFRLHHVCFTLNIKNYFKVCTTTLQILRRLGPGNCMCLIKHFRIISLVIIIELKRIFLI